MESQLISAMIILQSNFFSGEFLSVIFFFFFFLAHLVQSTMWAIVIFASVDVMEVCLHLLLLETKNWNIVPLVNLNIIYDFGADTNFNMAARDNNTICLMVLNFIWWILQ
jgi:hypothetical protein